MPNGTLVEAVALELQPVEAEVVEQVTLQLPRRFVGDPTAAEIRMRRKTAKIRDLAALVRDVESHARRRAATRRRRPPR